MGYLRNNSAQVQKFNYMQDIFQTIKELKLPCHHWTSVPVMDSAVWKAADSACGVQRAWADVNS